jgi:hypothetical protein
VVGIQGEGGGGGGEGEERVRFDVEDVMTMTEHSRELYPTIVLFGRSSAMTIHVVPTKCTHLGRRLGESAGLS